MNDTKNKKEEFFLLQKRPYPRASEDLALLFLLKDSLLGEKVVEWAEFYERKPTPFDTDFDANNDSALYCTEYVAKCINLACSKDTIQPTGEIQGKRFYRIDDIINVLD